MATSKGGKFFKTEIQELEKKDKHNGNEMETFSISAVRGRVMVGTKNGLRVCFSILLKRKSSCVEKEGYLLLNFRKRVVIIACVLKKDLR